MMVIADLKVFNPSSAMLIPSILMQPPSASMILNNPRVNDDFPAPVWPTTPTFSPGKIVNVTPKHMKQLHYYENVVTFKI